MSSHSSALFLAGLISAVTGAASEPSKDPAKSLADRIAAIKKEHQQRQKKFYDDLTTFRNDKKKIGELNQEYQKFTRKQAEELTALIKAHGREPAAFEGILVLVGELGYWLDEDLVRLVLKQHLADARMGSLCFALRYSSTEPWAKELLEAAATKHPQKAVRGQACYALGVYHRYRAQPYGKKLAEEETAKRLAEAARYFTEVTKGYAAVTTPDGKATLGDKAASELLRIKNLPDLKVGRRAPDIVGEDVHGRRFSLRDYRGKVVVLDFWGDW
jgi:hypothetical protein